MSSLQPFELQFLDSAIPALPAADYQITVTQSIEIDDGDSPPPYEIEQAVTVDGPHIALGATDVVAVYPPSGSQSGNYSQSLATVVLNRRTLPWEVNADPTGGTTAPWLAVLLLSPQEILWPDGTTPGGGTGVHTVTLDDYLQPPADTVVPRVAAEEWRSEYGADAPVTVVDVRWEAFHAVVPQLTELSWLCHVRQINTGGTSVLGIDEDGWYSVVVGNRLPSGAGMYAAHLVSLEGFAEYLPRERRPPIGKTTVRLLSLTNWTFNTVAGADFTALMANLNDDSLRLRTSPEPPPGIVATALASGYTALEYQTRLGEKTTAWYRGPCLPLAIAQNPQPPYVTADAALLYEATTGLFDVSYAAAWQTGRLLALADRQFVAALLNWVESTYHLRQRLAARRDFFDAHPFLDRPRDLLQPDAVRRAVRDYVKTALAQRLAKLRAGDPTGLKKAVGHLRGLLTAAEMKTITASRIEPNAAAVAAVRAKRRRP